MLSQEHKTLIQVLISKTDIGALPWEKGESRYSFMSKARENIFKLDKYFAGDENAPCLNLSTFGQKENLLMDIVLCKGMAEQKDDYDLLNSLYLKVEILVGGNSIQKDIPVVTSITQSLQQI